MHVQLSEGLLSVVDFKFLDGWFVSGIRENGRDVMASGFSTRPGKETELEMTVSNNGGIIEGNIRDKENNPLPGARYVLLPEKSLRQNRMLLQYGAAYEGGGFKIESVIPGDYRLIAFPDDDRFGPSFMRDLESIESYEAFGLWLHVDAGQTVSVTAVIVPNVRF